MKAPPRLIEDEAVAGELRADLERVRAAQSDYDAEAGRARLRAALGLPPAVGEGADPAADPLAPAKTAGATASAGAKLAGAAAAVGLVIAGVALWPAAAPPEPAPPRPAPAAETRPSAVPPPEPTSPAPERDRRSEIAGEAPAAELDRADSDDARLRREIAQVGRIKGLLPTDPRRAYRMAEAGHREFGRGMLYHEREGLAVLALFELGRTTSARDRARALLEVYPGSPLREQLEQRLRRSETSDGQPQP